jgi:hypothetical protein
MPDGRVRLHQMCAPVIWQVRFVGRQAQTLLVLLSIACGVSACATIPTTDPATLTGVSGQRHVANVPIYAQKDHYCGPAALAMALTWAGKPVSQDDVAPQVFTPDKKGAFRSDVLAAARRHGFLAVPVIGLSALLSELDAGHPVIVFQNLGLEMWPRWHFSVAVGYDLASGTLSLHNGEPDVRRMSLPLFERTWRRAGAWGLVVLPPSQLAASADLWRTMEAIGGLERTGHHQAATTAYEAAQTRWPDAWVPGFALGNLYLSLNDPAAAVTAYRQALARFSEAAEVWNNLAHALAMAGDRAAARDAANRAVALEPNNPTYGQTLAELK